MSPDLQQQILRKARNLLSDRRRWTRYSAARTGNGIVCTPYAPDAVKFCAYGAVVRAALEVTGSRQQAGQLARSIEMRLFGQARVQQQRLSHVNDCEGYAAVLALLDAAVERQPCTKPTATSGRTARTKGGKAHVKGKASNLQGRGRRT